MDATPEVKATEFGDGYDANVSGSDGYADVTYSKNYKISTYMTYYDAISYYAATLTSIRRKHLNVPNSTEFDNLKNLAVKIYDPLSTKFNIKIHVDSAYRNSFLNGPKDQGGVGGVTDSQHLFGEAMDINVNGTNVTNSQLFYYIANNLPYDQLIWEEGSITNPNWVHVSLKLDSTKNRKELLYKPNSSDNYLIAYNINNFNQLLA
jgi:hypothetical protein